MIVQTWNCSDTSAYMLNSVWYQFAVEYQLAFIIGDEIFFWVLHEADLMPVQLF